MTGFGRSAISRDGREIEMELKSVNHRYLDLHFRLPKSLAFAEEPLRKWIRGAQIKRGHLEVSVIYRNNRTDAKTVALDRELVEQCARETQDAADALKKDSPTVYELIKLCDALTISEAEEDTDAVLTLMEEAFLDALASLQMMREAEGETLREDLHDNLQAAGAAAGRVRELAPAVPQEYRERLLNRLKEWEVEIADPARIAQEVALIADKCAIDEELSRLQSHFRQFAECLTQDGETGRRMDFLLQEMNREINTIGSKASSAEITKCVVELKSVLEKLREQVQNIE
ncbi:MAG: YicC family protein [Clostridiales bacterium]|nr:YicC family protein [Clostridiales bacterium]